MALAQILLLNKTDKQDKYRDINAGNSSINSWDKSLFYFLGLNINNIIMQCAVLFKIKLLLI